MAYIYYVELRISRGFLRNKAVFNIGSTDFALLFLTYEHVFRQSYTIPEYNWLNFSIFRQKQLFFEIYILRNGRETAVVAHHVASCNAAIAYAMATYS